ncbi:MAG: glutamine amidotransferase [Ruminococcaceae bacterium]|nr:glutamine amidotransferase [Oscillospiraceae bacterium]
MNYEIKIGHLFSDLLNMFGDKGNIASLENRMKWRGFSVETVCFREQDEISFDGLDIVILGGGGEKDELNALKKLMEKRKELKAYVESGGILLAFCGGFRMLGKYFKTKTQTVEGLGIFDMVTEYGERFIGNVIAETEITGERIKIAGFENHGGRTILKGVKPFAYILSGEGNNGEDKTEGAIYKNAIGTYLHGPLLPKNPRLADHILKAALERKYDDSPCLCPLSDELENEALSYAINRFLKAEV